MPEHYQFRRDQQLLNELIEKWNAIELNCERTKERIAENAFKALYLQLNLPEPRIIWFDSPLELCLAMKRYNKWAEVGGDLLGRDRFQDPPGARTSREWQLADWVGHQIYDVNDQSVGSTISSALHDHPELRSDTRFQGMWREIMHGQHDEKWLMRWEYVQQKYQLDWLELWLQPRIQIAKQVGWWVPTYHAVFASRKHVSLHVDQNRCAHNETTAAIVYPNAWAIYAWHGMVCPESAIAYPHAMSKRFIDQQFGRLRDFLIERYGATRYWIESGARKIHEDEFGVLYDIPLGSRMQRSVRVLNATPEPDGTFKEYFIDVPPTVTRAKEAVAWTFGMPAHEYEPVVQS
jgi:hypothetical protein